MLHWFLTTGLRESRVKRNTRQCQPAVLKHDNIQHSLEHLLENFRPHLRIWNIIIDPTEVKQKEIKNWGHLYQTMMTLITATRGSFSAEVWDPRTFFPTVRFEHKLTGHYTTPYTFYVTFIINFEILHAL